MINKVLPTKIMSNCKRTALGAAIAMSSLAVKAASPPPVPIAVRPAPSVPIAVSIAANGTAAASASRIVSKHNQVDNKVSPESSDVEKLQKNASFLRSEIKKRHIEIDKMEQELNVTLERLKNESAPDNYSKNSSNDELLDDNVKNSSEENIDCGRVGKKNLQKEACKAQCAEKNSGGRFYRLITMLAISTLLFLAVQTVRAIFEDDFFKNKHNK